MRHTPSDSAFLSCLATSLVLGWTLAITPASVEAQVSPSSLDRTELQQTLRLFQLDESVWAFFRDDSPMSPDEQEPIHRLLHVLNRLDAWQRYQWSQPVTDWQSVDSAPESARGRLFQVFGEAIGWQPMPVPPETAKRYGHPFIYRIEVLSSVDQRRLFVYVRRLPASWPRQAPASDLPRLPVRCDAIFLKTGETIGDKASLYFAGDHLAWYPDAPLPAPWNVPADLATLGSHQFDVTLLDTLSPRPQLTHEDSECFYRLLATARRLRLAGDRNFGTAAELPIESLLSKPADLRSQIFRVVGTARRALRIAVEDPQDRQRLGIHHYYEVECMVATRRELVDRDSGIAYGSFPVTICLPELPESIPQGDQIRVDIEATGIFLKLWSFQNDYLTSTRSADEATAQAKKEANEKTDTAVRQLAPLLIGIQIRPLSPPTVTRQGWSSWALLGILALALASAAGLWFVNRPGDQRYQQWRKRRERLDRWQNQPGKDIGPPDDSHTPHA